MSKIINSEQNSEQIVKFIIASILLIDVAVLFLIGQALYNFVNHIAGGL